jgi:hypothetical protein
MGYWRTTGRLAVKMTVTHFAYKAFTIDATPDLSLGRFFARTWITHCPTEGDEEGETHEASDLGQFDIEAEAVAFAHQGVIDWIDENWD